MATQTSVQAAMASTAQTLHLCHTASVHLTQEAVRHYAIIVLHACNAS